MRAYFCVWWSCRGVPHCPSFCNSRLWIFSLLLDLVSARRFCGWRGPGSWISEIFRFALFWRVLVCCCEFECEVRMLHEVARPVVCVYVHIKPCIVLIQCNSVLLQHFLLIRTLSVVFAWKLDPILPNHLIFHDHPCSMLITSTNYVALDCSASTPIFLLLTSF